MLKKRTLIAVSRAIEEETLSRAAAPVVVAAFQASATTARSSTAIARWRGTPTPCSCSPTSMRSPADGEGPVEVPLGSGQGLGNEWAVVVDAPGYGACLLGWEQPRARPVPDDERTFEAMWTLDPRLVRRAVQVGAMLARRADAALGDRIDALLAERPLAFEQPAPA